MSHLVPLVAGNWKMNGSAAQIDEVRLMANALPLQVEVLVCPPATQLAALASLFAKTGLKFGGQNCHELENGAYTGDISAVMLRDAGASHVILGHSERRLYHHETNAQVCLKADAAIAAGLVPIVCVGETLQQREAGDALDVVEEHLAGSLPDAASGIVIAYEPIWAIGTGKVASIEDITQMHAHIRSYVDGKLPRTASTIRILYGGSVKAGNAAEIFAVPNVHGALVGGASLKAADFLPIVNAAKR